MRPFDPRLLRAAPAARRPVAALAVVGVLQGVATIALAFALARPRRGRRRGQSLRTPALWLAGLFGVRAGSACVAERVAAWVGVEVTVALRRAAARPVARATGRAPARSPTARHARGPGRGAVEPYAARFLPALVAGVVVPVLAVGALVVVDRPSALIVVLTLPLLPLFAALIGRATQSRPSAAGGARDAGRALPRRHARAPDARRLRAGRAPGRGRRRGHRAAPRARR